VATLDQRLVALERQMADLLRQSEESGHRLQSLESDLAKSRTQQEQRLSTLEQRINDAASAAAAQPAAAEPAVETRPSATKPSGIKPSAKPSGTKSSSTAKGEGGPVLPSSTAAITSLTTATDAGEDAYSQAFRLWEAGQYDDAIAALKAFVVAYPKHRRVSYANNLIGRSLLDKGQARDAAAVFLANYRGNPGGERAPDSLFYLGQAVMKLGQPGQACRAYAEFDAIYGAKARTDLKKQVADAKAQAQCG
jgi:TolA-binding protein